MERTTGGPSGASTDELPRILELVVFYRPDKFDWGLEVMFEHNRIEWHYLPALPDMMRHCFETYPDKPVTVIPPARLPA